MKTPTDLVEFKLFCRCGAAWTGIMPAAQVVEVKRVWRLTHDGNECGPATKAQAGLARRRAEEQAERAMR